MTEASPPLHDARGAVGMAAARRRSRRCSTISLADNPVLATGLGLTAGADRLPSWSAPAIARRIGMLRRHERALLPLLDDPRGGDAVDAFIGLQIAHRLSRALLKLARCIAR